MRLWWAGGALLLAAGCPRKIPEHLRPESSASASQVVDIDDVPELIAALVRTDPLGRASEGITADQARALPNGEPFAQMLEAAAELRPGAVAPLSQLRALESQHEGTAIVPLARGARVREIEASLGGRRTVDEATQNRILALLTPLSASTSQATYPLEPLHWLAPAPPLRGPVLAAADRWALLGWLDGPGIDVEPVAESLRSPPFDALRRTPAGKLVLARATGAPGDPTQGLAALERATTGLLADAVADGNKAQAEQAVWWKRVGEELGSDDPRDALLALAERELRAAAQDPRGTGGALLALQARRWWGDCPTAPCVGLDRVGGFAAAGRWDARLARHARLLQLAALVESIDGMDVARDTVRWHRAMVDLVDSLAGSGAEPPDSLVLRQRSPDPSTWLAIARSVGAEQATTWDEADAALRTFAAARARALLEGESDPTVRRHLQSIADRG